jgi:hypothetical protein
MSLNKKARLGRALSDPVRTVTRSNDVHMRISNY